MNKGYFMLNLGVVFEKVEGRDMFKFGAGGYSYLNSISGNG